MRRRRIVSKIRPLIKPGIVIAGFGYLVCSKVFPSVPPPRIVGDIIWQIILASAIVAFSKMPNIRRRAKKPQTVALALGNEALHFAKFVTAFCCLAVSFWIFVAPYAAAAAGAAHDVPLGDKIRWSRALAIYGHHGLDHAADLALSPGMRITTETCSPTTIADRADFVRNDSPKELLTGLFYGQAYCDAGRDSIATAQALENLQESLGWGGLQMAAMSAHALRDDDAARSLLVQFRRTDPARFALFRRTCKRGWCRPVLQSISSLPNGDYEGPSLRGAMPF